MNNLKLLLLRLIVSLIVMLIGLTGIVHAEIENVTVECGVNKCFILCQPNIQTIESLSAYIEQAHARLSQVDQSLIVDAVVTFVKPVSSKEIDLFIQAKNITNISLRSISEGTGELNFEYPLTETESETFDDINVLSNFVSMRLTTNVSSLLMMTLDSNVLCVDAGDLAQLEKYSNAMIIVMEDIYQSAFLLDSLGKESSNLIPEGYSLFQNYPNPFNPQTEISFNLPKTTDVKLEIYNTLGQLVTVLFDGKLEAGLHLYKWDGTNIASGMYLYRLMTDDFSSTKKMLLLK